MQNIGKLSNNFMIYSCIHYLIKFISLRPKHMLQTFDYRA